MTNPRQVYHYVMPGRFLPSAHQRAKIAAARARVTIGEWLEIAIANQADRDEANALEKALDQDDERHLLEGREADIRKEAKMDKACWESAAQAVRDYMEAIAPYKRDYMEARAQAERDCDERIAQADRDYMERIAPYKRDCDERIAQVKRACQGG